MQAAFPRPGDQEAARRFIDSFRARLPDAAWVPDSLLACLGGNSPYLTELALRDPDLLADIARRGPDAVCDEALFSLRRLDPALTKPALAAALRQAKRTVALAAAIGDLSGDWPLEQVTGALSDLADGALRAATAFLLRQAHRKGDLTLPHPESPEQGSGFVVLGMGKLGARELNFSSDVDLVLLFDPDTYPDRTDSLAHVFTRLSRDLAGLMEARDAGGYVFRVDLRLRPDPASTPPAISLPAALAYYEGLGQTWERAAMIKARPLAGDIALGRRFLAAIRPFIWRRHLDFAAIADIRDMKRRVDAHRGTALAAGPAAQALLGHNLRLGQGGIREVEFCAQTLQLVWGGREPALRVPGTLAALAAERDAGHLPADWERTLRDAYRFLRTAEHRVQMVADRQTHSLPTTPPKLAEFAVFMGFADTASFAETLAAHLHAVHGIFAPLLSELTGEAPPEPEPALAVALPETWLQGRPRSLRNERSRDLLRGMMPALATALARQPDPAAAVARFDEFLHRLPAGVQVFSMLRHNPALLNRLADVLGASPWLADHLASFPAALEGLAFPEPIDPDPAASLALRLADAAALDDALPIASRMVRAEEFAIAVGEYFGRIDADRAGQDRTRLAEAVITGLLTLAAAEHAVRHGETPGGGATVVALGKAGSAELSATSDLDLMLIYDAAGAAESNGPKPLSAMQYFGRLSHRLIAALTVPTRHGPLYQVDMRLRPSGGKGPVAVSLDSFIRYHREEAWTWERLALTRSRVIAGPDDLRARVAAAIDHALLAGDHARIMPDTASMRARQMKDLPPRGFWDVKRRPGGLIEVEFIAQALTLRHLPSRQTSRPAIPATRALFAWLAGEGALPPDDAALLIEADRAWRRILGVLRIALGSQSPAAVTGPVLDHLLAAGGMGADEAAFRHRVDALAAAARDAFIRLVGKIESA